MGLGLPVHSFCHLQHDGALNTLTMKVAAQLIGTGQGTGSVIGIGGTAAAAEHLGKAIVTFFAGIYIAELELIPQFGILNAMEYIAQFEFFVADKLVTRV